MRPAVALVLVLLVTLGGCASPDPSFYTLAAVPGVAQAGGPKRVLLRRPGLAGYLDRPEIVRSGSPYQLRLASGERWGEPLGDLVGRILAEDLSQRLPGSSVFTEAGSITAEREATLELDLQRFDAGADGVVVLAAQVSVQRTRVPGTSITRTVRREIRPANPSTAALVAAMSTGLGQLADMVAGLLRKI